jgi:hypothetical protein
VCLRTDEGGRGHYSRQVGRAQDLIVEEAHRSTQVRRCFRSRGDQGHGHILGFRPKLAIVPLLALPHEPGVNSSFNYRPLRRSVFFVVSITERGRQCFSVVIATDGASERRLLMRFNTRADAEVTVANLKRSIDRLPSRRKAATARHGRTDAS